LAKRFYAALVGQQSLVPNQEVDAIVERSASALARSLSSRSASPEATVDAQTSGDSDVVAVHTDRVEVEQVREAGSVHVAHQMWERLGIGDILAKAGFDAKARTLAEILTINRLVRPCSEHATPDWVRRTAIGDILGVDVSKLGDDALYRHLDELHPQRGAIERGPARARAIAVQSRGDALALRHDVDVLRGKMRWEPGGEAGVLARSSWGLQAGGRGAGA